MESLAHAPAALCVAGREGLRLVTELGSVHEVNVEAIDEVAQTLEHGVIPGVIRRRWVTGDDAIAKAREWIGYGFDDPAVARWIAVGVYEPAVAADLAGAGYEPRAALFISETIAGMPLGQALAEGDLSLADFERLFADGGGH